MAESVFPNPIKRPACLTLSDMLATVLRAAPRIRSLL